MGNESYFKHLLMGKTKQLLNFFLYANNYQHLDFVTLHLTLASEAMKFRESYHTDRTAALFPVPSTFHSFFGP